VFLDFLVRRRRLRHQRLQTLRRERRDHHEDDDQHQQHVDHRRHINVGFRAACPAANCHSHTIAPCLKLFYFAAGVSRLPWPFSSILSVSRPNWSTPAERRLSTTLTTFS